MSLGKRHFPYNCLKKPSVTDVEKGLIFCLKWTIWYFLNYFEHCNTRKNCSLWAISHFATIFLTWLNNCTFIYRDFSFVCLDVLQIDCCRFFECRKVLISIYWRNILLMSCARGWPTIGSFVHSNYSDQPIQTHDHNLHLPSKPQ